MTALLLDTHALLWWMSDDVALNTGARAAIAEPQAAVAVSSVSIWEIAIKRRLGKLQAPDDPLADIEVAGFQLLPFDAHHAWLAGHLEMHHSDPFDRALIAQALIGGLRVVTADSRFGLYGVEVVPA